MTERPFTAAVCLAGPCRDRGLDLLPRLAKVVRTCPHGVLLRTGCLLHSERCRPGAACDSSGFVLVQRCDRERRPQGAATLVGPVLTAADAEALECWLVGGSPDASRSTQGFAHGWPPDSGGVGAAPSHLRTQR